MNTQSIKDKIKKLEREAVATESLINDIQELPEPSLVCWQNSSLCEFSLSYKVKTVEQAKEIINQFESYILPLELSKGTFTTFRTPEHKPERGQTTAESIFPVTVKVSKYGINFEFYAKVNGHLLSIDVESDYGVSWHDLARVSWEEGYNKYGKWIKNIYCHTDGFNNPQKIKWASGGSEYPNDFTLYWQYAKTLEDIFYTE